jgi:hypothetical protein
MDEPRVNQWAGKSTEDVLTESYHEIRNPIYIEAGYLNVLKSASQVSLSPEQVQDYLELAFNHVTRAQKIVESVIQYMNEK